MKRSGIAAVLAVLTLSGCGTYLRGTTEDVKINTRPSGARVTTSLGDSCARSPCTFKVKRNKAFDAFAAKPGYRQGQVHVGTKISKDGATKTAGNLLLPGGTVGLVVDTVNGAALDHTPNPATIVLKPGKRGKAKPILRRKPAGKKRRGIPVS